MNQPEPQPPPIDPFFFYWKTWQKALLVLAIVLVTVALMIVVCIRVYQKGHGTDQ